MPYLRFLSFSVAGALAWVLSLCLAGYWFGNIPAVKENLGAVILAIVVISVIPMAAALLRARRRPAA
jgi:membrane-associated protein